MWSEPIPAVTISFSFGALANALVGHVRRPERLGDDDIGVVQLAVEHRVGTLLVGGDDRARGPAISRNSRKPSSPETLPSSCRA